MVVRRVVELPGKHAGVEVLEVLHLGDELLAGEVAADLVQDVHDRGRAARPVEGEVGDLLAGRQARLDDLAGLLHTRTIHQVLELEQLKELLHRLAAAEPFFGIEEVGPERAKLRHFEPELVRVA